MTKQLTNDELIQLLFDNTVLDVTSIEEVIEVLTTNNVIELKNE